MKSKHLLIISLIFAALISFPGCSIIPKTARTGAQVTIEEAAGIIDGKTRKEDLILDFGEPSKVLEGGTIWIYSGSKTVEWLGVPFGGGKRLVIVFDKGGNGLVQQHSFRED